MRSLDNKQAGRTYAAGNAERKTKTRSILLKESVLKAAQAKADKMGISFNEFTNRALERAIKCK